MILTSKNNPLIKETASLKEKKGRKLLGMLLVEGRKRVLECQNSGLSIDRVFYSESYQGERLQGVPDTLVSDEVFRALSDEKTPQGILCRVNIPVLPLDAPMRLEWFLSTHSINSLPSVVTSGTTHSMTVKPIR